MFQELEEINRRPAPFELYTAGDLWTEPYISEQMLRLHLDEEGDVASRNATFIDRSVEWIASRFDLTAGTTIADFGCGPGLYSSRLARRGARVTGIDFSTRSIRHATAEAKADNLPVSYVTQNYLEYETEKGFDLILMITCDFCALSPAQRELLASRFFSFLNPGGHVLLDVYSVAAFQRRQERAGYELHEANGFWTPNRCYEFSNTFRYEQEWVVLDKYTIIEPDRARTIYNWFQHFDRDAIATELAASGLAVTDFHADVAGAPFDPDASEFAVVAERSGE